MSSTSPSQNLSGGGGGSDPSGAAGELAQPQQESRQLRDDHDSLSQVGLDDVDNNNDSHDNTPYSCTDEVPMSRALPTIHPVVESPAPEVDGNAASTSMNASNHSSAAAVHEPMQGRLSESITAHTSSHNDSNSVHESSSPQTQRLSPPLPIAAPAAAPAVLEREPNTYSSASISHAEVSVSVSFKESSDAQAPPTQTNRATVGGGEGRGAASTTTCPGEVFNTTTIAAHLMLSCRSQGGGKDGVLPAAAEAVDENPKCMAFSASATGRGNTKSIAQQRGLHGGTMRGASVGYADPEAGCHIADSSSNRASSNSSSGLDEIEGHSYDGTGGLGKEGTDHPAAGQQQHAVEGYDFNADGSPSNTMRMRDKARNMFLTPIHLPMMRSPSVMLLPVNNSNASNRNASLPAPLSAITVTSPMRVESSVLEESFKDDEPVKSRHKGVVYYVRQSRSVQGSCTFDISFLSLRVNDIVTFEWFDAAQHIYETTKSYDRVVPGGRSSTTRLPEGMDGRDAPILTPKARDELTGTTTFSTRFTVPGDYYFICSKNKWRMRLHVQVATDRIHRLTCGILTLLSILFMVIVIVVVVLVLAYWLQKKDLFLSREDAVSETQYDGFKQLQSIVTLYVFPWLATGILIFLVIIILAVLQAILRRYRPPRQGSWHRGVKTSVRKILSLGTILFCLGNVVLLFVAYGLQLNVTDGINNFAQQLSSSITSTISAFSVTLYQVDWLVTEGPSIVPNVAFPVEDVEKIVHEIDSILNDTVRWTRTGEDIVQGAFRLLPILLFLTLQIGLFGYSMAVGAVLLRFRKPSAAVAWILAVCVGVYACAAGVVWAESRLMKEIYNSAVAFRDEPGQFYGQLGLANDSVVAQVFASCQMTDVDVQFVSEYVNGILSEINASLSPENQEEFSTLFGFFQDIVPVGLDALVNYTSYIQANLDLLIEIVSTDGDAVNHFFNMDIFPFLQVLFSVVDTLKGLIDCRIIRDIIASAIPVLKDDVESYLTGLLVFLFIIFAVSVPALIFAASSAYAMAHPRKQWYEPRTGRWFRLRYSYKIHRKLALKTARAEAAEVVWMNEMQRSAEPLMHQLLTVKFIGYAASLLMFFDAILLVLFNDIARTISTAPLLRALSYLGCVQLIFLLAASLFRQVWMRWIFHGLALLVVLGCLGIAFAQAIAGFIKFSDCITALSTSTDAILGANPYYNYCPVAYIGHEIEIAIYGIVVFLNSVTLTVTLILLLVHERKQKAMFMKRHYVGFFSPIESSIPSLDCLFRDYLRVKRVYVSAFIVIVVVLLILIAVTDNGQFQLVGYRTQSVRVSEPIVQVLDPNVACNGDPRYCDLRINKYIWACAHNAHSSLEDGFVFADHYYNISHQLQAGIRSFMIDLWYDIINVTESNAQGVYVCHNICLAGRRPFKAIAQEYYNFIQQYPSQVIMIIIEQYVNSSDIHDIMHEVGLDQYVWYNTQPPPSQNANYVWPTFKELIDANQRVMMFNDCLATNARSAQAPEWLYYSYNFQFENSYQTSDVAQWRCDIGRGWCTSELDKINQTDASNSSSSSSASSSLDCANVDLSDSGVVLLNPRCIPPSAIAPDYWEKWARDITNCTGVPGPWKEGSDRYNTYMGGGNPPLVSAKLSTMNHFITNGVASPVQASKANVPVSIQFTTFNCSTYWNQVINILAFDYWTIANPLVTIEAMNQNLLKYGKANHYKSAWGKMLLNDPGYTVESGLQQLDA